jgi:hypothetical protein
MFGVREEEQEPAELFSKIRNAYRTARPGG